MGIFGSRKKIYVSSVVYNLAGDENLRPNYLKTTVIGATLADDNRSMAEQITSSYIKGPGIKLRSFARWSRTSGYTDTIGLVTGNISVGNSVNISVLKTQIPHAPTEEVMIQTVDIGDPDYSYWSEQYMLQNYPSLINTDWTADISDETKIITITFEGGGTVSFLASTYDPAGRFLYTSYMLGAGREEGPTETGDVIPLGSGDPWPSTSGWDEISNVETDTDVELETKVVTEITYSDSRPPEGGTTTSTRTETYEQIHRLYERETYKGTNPAGNGTYSLKEFMYQDQVDEITEDVEVTTTDEDIGGGVIKTTKVTTTTQNLELDRSYRIDEQEITQSSWGPTQIMIYQQGTGNAVLDAMFAPDQLNDQFFPFIPFRLDNKFVSESYLPEVYGASKKAFKKATGGKFDNTIDQIADNEDLSDIDYTYAVFGVSLNVKENSCKKYVYRFFKSILDTLSIGGDGAYTAWKTQWNIADASIQAWNTWRVAQSNPSDPLYGTPEPAKLTYPAMPMTDMRITSGTNPTMNFDMTISWTAISEETGTGLGKPGVRQGDCWFVTGASEEFEEVGYVGGQWGSLINRFLNNITLYYQDSPDTWRRIVIRGLKHRNAIYKGKAVEIDGLEALQDTDESGFIIPLHEGVYRSMSLKDATQMSTACAFLVFNCYQVVKKKWYQTGLFQVILIIVVIVVSVFFPPAGAAAGGGGVLGSSAVVGGALGFTGTTAIIVGAIANAIAAMVITAIIKKAAIALFGERLGTLIGALVSIVTLQVATGLANGQSLASSFANMMRADNLLALTNAGVGAYTDYVAASTQDILQKTQKLLEEYKTESDRISQAYADTFGSNQGIIDPMLLTDSSRRSGTESPDAFLTRTLMMGGDIVDMSMDMLNNFAQMTINTDLPAS